MLCLVFEKLSVSHPSLAPFQWPVTDLCWRAWCQNVRLEKNVKEVLVTQNASFKLISSLVDLQHFSQIPWHYLFSTFTTFQIFALFQVKQASLIGEDY